MSLQQFHTSNTDCRRKNKAFSRSLPRYFPFSLTFSSSSVFPFLRHSFSLSLLVVFSSTPRGAPPFALSLSPPRVAPSPFASHPRTGSHPFLSLPPVPLRDFDSRSALYIHRKGVAAAAVASRNVRDDIEIALGRRAELYRRYAARHFRAAAGATLHIFHRRSCARLALESPWRHAC